MSLSTPESVQKLQAALHDKAKKSPDFRFYALYDKVYRKDVLSFAYQCSKANGGTAGVSGAAEVEIRFGARPEDRHTRVLTSGRSQAQPIRVGVDDPNCLREQHRLFADGRAVFLESKPAQFRPSYFLVDWVRNLDQKHPVPIIVMILAGCGELMRSAVSNRLSRGILIGSIGWIEPSGLRRSAKPRHINCDCSSGRNVHNDR